MATQAGQLDPRDRLGMEDVRSAVKRLSVDFSALDYTRSKGLEHSEFAKLYPEVLEAFQKTNGPMLQTFFFKEGSVTVAMSPRRWRMHWFLGRKPTLHEVLEESGAPENVLPLYGRCGTLTAQVDQTLRGERRATSIDGPAIYSRMFSGIEEAAGGAEYPTAHLKLIESALEYEEAAFNRAAISTLKGRFLVGMLFALPVVLGLGVLTAWVLGRAHLSLYEPSHYAVSFTMGAVGAVVSAMRRMSKGTADMTPETSRVSALASGFAPPFVGAIFGSVIYFALASDLLGVGLSGSPEQKFFAIATLAFLAGMSERVARGMLSAIPGAGSVRDESPNVHATDTTGLPPASEAVQEIETAKADVRPELSELAERMAALERRLDE